MGSTSKNKIGGIISLRKSKSETWWLIYTFQLMTRRIAKLIALARNNPAAPIPTASNTMLPPT